MIRIIFDFEQVSAASLASAVESMSHFAESESESKLFNDLSSILKQAENEKISLDNTNSKTIEALNTAV